MGIQDLILGPIYLIIVFIIAAQLKSRLVVTEYDNKVYYKVLGFKLFAVTFFACIYFFYYGGGDTFGFFAWSQRLVQYFFEDPSRALSFIYDSNLENFYTFKYSKNVRYYQYLLKYGTREVFFIKCMFVINLLGMNTYIAVSYLLALFSFIANWLLYKVFVKKYPSIAKQLVIAVLLIPSVAFWGGGVLKDTLAFVGICFVVYTCNEIFIYKKKVVRNILFFILFTYLIVALRGFVVLSLLPAIIFWIFAEYKEKIASPFIRIAATPFIVIISVVVIGAMLVTVGNELDRFSLDSIDETVKDFQGWHEVASADGSGYSLHVSGSSPFEMLKAFPAGINVTFFRPYLWEVSGMVVLLSAIEALLIFVYFLNVFFLKGKIFGFLKILMTEPLVQLCLIFACLYGFSVGFTSYNFGALSRYKIPAMPFFVTMLVLINHKLTKNTAKK